MARIVVTRPLVENGLAALSGHDVRIIDRPDAALSEEQLIDYFAGARGVITMLSDPLTARVFEACTELKVVSQYAVGYDNIDLEAARARGIVVTHTPGVLTDATADLTMALLLAISRRIVEADRYVRDGHFHRWETKELLGIDLQGKTLGILGMGRIGLAVARRAVAFGMKILYHNRTRVNPTSERRLGAHYVSFDALIERSDVLSIHAPLNAESRELFDRAALHRMKRGAILINTARGAIVDEAALVAALNDGHLGGAGLDVYEREPLVHPGLIESDRVVLAPHLGSATVETRTRMAEMCATSLLAALSDAPTIPHRLV